MRDNGIVKIKSMCDQLSELEEPKVPARGRD